MPTVIEPKGNEPKPKVETTQPNRNCFSEIQMEKSSSNIFPLILIFGLIVVVGGTIYYFVRGAAMS